MQTATPRTPKPPYSPACEVTGCIDLNKKLVDAIRERGDKYPDERKPISLRERCAKCSHVHVAKQGAANWRRYRRP